MTMWPPGFPSCVSCCSCSWNAHPSPQPGSLCNALNTHRWVIPPCRLRQKFPLLCTMTCVTVSASFSHHDPAVRDHVAFIPTSLMGACAIGMCHVVQSHSATPVSSTSPQRRLHPVPWSLHVTTAIIGKPRGERTYSMKLALALSYCGLAMCQPCFETLHMNDPMSSSLWTLQSQQHCGPHLRMVKWSLRMLSLPQIP